MIQNSAWLIADRLVRVAGGFIVGVWTARYLGASDFGLLSYCIAYASLFSIFSTLGLDGIVVKEASTGNVRVSALLGTSFTLRIVGALFATVISVAIAALFGKGSLTLIMIAISSSVLVAQSLYVIDFIMQARMQNKLSVIAQGSGFLISTAIKILLIVNEMPVIYFVIANLIEAIAAASLLLIIYFRQDNSSRWEFDKKVAFQLMSESWPLFLSGFAYLAYVRVDQIMIEHFLGARDVGLYSAAIRISEAWNMIPVIAVTVAFPKLLQLRQKNALLYKARMQDLFGSIALLAILAALFTSVCSGWLISVLYGAEYAQSAQVLAISAWNSVFVALGFVAGRWMIAEGLTKFALVRNLFGLVSNIGLNLFLIPAYGIFGAALGTLISYAIANLLSYGINRKLFPLLAMNLRALSVLGWLYTLRISK